MSWLTFLHFFETHCLFFVFFLWYSVPADSFLFFFWHAKSKLNCQSSAKQLPIDGMVHGANWLSYHIKIQTGRPPFGIGHFQLFLLNEKFSILIEISLGLTDHNSALVQATPHESVGPGNDLTLKWQQAISWTSVDQNILSHISSIGQYDCSVLLLPTEAVGNPSYQFYK